MKKIPFSRLAAPCALLLITLIDFAIAIKDIVNQKAATGVLILVMGIVIGYAAVKTLLNTMKRYK